MALVDAHVWYWTLRGMTEVPLGTTGYIERTEVEKLLEAAHRRGWEGGHAAALEEAKRD